MVKHHTLGGDQCVTLAKGYVSTKWRCLGSAKGYDSIKRRDRAVLRPRTAPGHPPPYAPPPGPSPPDQTLGSPRAGENGRVTRSGAERIWMARGQGTECGQMAGGGQGPPGDRLPLSVEESGPGGPEGASSVQMIPDGAGSPGKAPPGPPDKRWPLPEHRAPHGPDRQQDRWEAALRDKKTRLVLIGIGILFLTIILTSPLLRNHALAPSPAFCPDGWTPFRQSCYFFYADGRTWDVSTGLCYVNGSFLVVLEDLQELEFIRKHTKGELWIGLRRRREDLYWVNGTKLDPTVFPVAGSGECAYTDPAVFSTSSCSLTRSFICKRAKAR
ncbi:C-type lectin domain family 2 member L-like [Tachyglossus aculeatus]|uniref:C-type lectin domain family 2 member L-like n=1 Tax=Tachyglossus aculeatus TaxID=9261 RepID=UPI0018F714EA|nr:C-type lectin domain family 2 member L-like [Tachyglossus aculeatus]